MYNKSTVSPDKYQERFLNLTKLIFKKDDASEIIKSNRNEKKNDNSIN